MDQLTDNNPVEFVALKALLTDGPDFIQEKEGGYGDVTQLPKNAFAHPFSREFPIDNPGNTYDSKVYLEAYAHTMEVSTRDSVHASLEKAAIFHGIEDQFPKIESAADVSIKLATANKADEPEYALIYEGDDNKQIAVYPINDVQDVIDSSVKLACDRDKMPVDWFSTTCQTIMKAAAKFEVHSHYIPEIVTQHGIEREYCVKSADCGLSQRLNLVRERAWKADEEVDEDMITLYKEAFKMAKEATDEGERKELLDVISDLDHTYEVDYKHVMDPYNAFYNGVPVADIEKAASQFVFIGDAHIPVPEFIKVSEERLTQEFSATVAESIKAARTSAEEGFKSGDAAKVADATHALEALPSEHKAGLINLILDVAA